MLINVPPDVRITAIEPAGYGVQPVFSDGHARGIYPWAYLNALASAAMAGGIASDTAGIAR